MTWLACQPDAWRWSAFERVLLLDALSTRNDALFWPALALAGRVHYETKTRWLPCNEDLAYLVKVFAREWQRRDERDAMALERRRRIHVTVTETAAVLGCSEVHARRLIKAGTIRAKKLATKPNRWEVDNESVYAYMRIRKA